MLKAAIIDCSMLWP